MAYFNLTSLKVFFTNAWFKFLVLVGLKKVQKVVNENTDTVGSDDPQPVVKQSVSSTPKVAKKTAAKKATRIRVVKK